VLLEMKGVGIAKNNKVAPLGEVKIHPPKIENK
jgi:hypothetical protein